ncbi:MAG: hypothetical protein H6Q67_816 [Firmicutes bacterium]|nr:hypothetical protein [Bacillota bacterium]
MNNCVAKIRQQRKESQDAFAKRVNISRTHLSEIENGKADPGGKVMLKIASALNKNVEDIFFVNDVV